jgi:hypothetical protein
MAVTPHHHLTFWGDPTEYDSVAIQGECSCGCWFEMRVAPTREPKYLGDSIQFGSMFQVFRPELRGSMWFNGYPPCPAVAPFRVFEKECV